MPESLDKHDWVRLSRLGHSDILFPNLGKALHYLQRTAPGYTLGNISSSKTGRAAMCDNGPYMDVITWTIPVRYDGQYENGKIVIYSCVE